MEAENSIGTLAGARKGAERKIEHRGAEKTKPKKNDDVKSPLQETRREHG